MYDLLLWRTVHNELHLITSCNYRDVKRNQFRGPLTAGELLDAIFPMFEDKIETIARD